MGLATPVAYTQPLAEDMKQAEMYARLRQIGSSWLKKSVVYADRQLIVINKPPGLICQLNHKSKGKETDMTPFMKDIQHWISSEPHLVHRLDKGTTGCLLVAANHSSARTISHQLRQGTVTKTYLALVQGGSEAFPNLSGRIRDHILYHDGRGEIHKDGKLAITEWKLLSSSTRVPLSLVELTLLTGNKHQLRLHLANCLEVPILGDSLYSKINPIPRSLYGWTKVHEDRIFLHASEVSLYYLRTGTRFRLSVRAPLPADFSQICRDVGITIPLDLQTEGLHVSETRVSGHPELNELRLWHRNHHY